MKGIQVNGELFSGIEYFAKAEIQRELTAFFKFDQRRVILGEGALEQLGEECRRLGAGRVLLVQDPGVAALGEEVQRVLAEGGIAMTGIFDQIAPNPTVVQVEACALAIAAAGSDAVVALGGGSTIDTVKAAVWVATAGQPIDCFYGFDRIPGPARWPVLAIPTTAGTGSEVSRVSVVADETGKKAVYSDYLTPQVALVDPQLHQGMPASLTAVTGLDALSHALECTASKKSNPLGDAVARESLRAGCPHLLRAIEHGEDREARYQMARCSLLAGLLLSPINTGAAHALGYGIEKVSAVRERPVPHGAAVALVLPGVMRHNMPAAADKYYFAAGVAGLELKGQSQEEGVRRIAAWLEGVRRTYTPYGSLQQTGLTEAEISPMVEVAMGVRRLLDPNPVEVTPQDAERIYREVLT